VSAHIDDVAEVAGEPHTPLEIGGALSLGLVGLLMGGLMALLLGELADEHRISAAGIGVTAMLEALSIGLVTGLAGIVLQPRRLRLIAVLATGGLIVANLATVTVSGLALMAVRALAGIPQGLMLWIAIGLISRTVTPERWAGVFFTGMGLSQLGVAAGLSAWVLPRFDANGGYVTAAVVTALAFPLAALIPSRLGEVPGADPLASRAPPPRGWLALAAALCFTAAFTAVAVYVMPLAHQAGLSVAVGRTAISVALACQILGGALATALAGRVRYITVFWGVSAVFLAIWTGYFVGPPAAVFVAITGLAGLCGMLAGPFLVPMTIEADPTRRTAMQSGAVQLLAGALGPLLAAFVVSDSDAHGVLILAAGLMLLGLAVVVVLHRLANARPAQALASR
jgi:predicted MFS family arabinose efflux permease